ncbi:YpmS family protein [Lentilactobacillus fungorum]|nr:YpmS family protein [Lentilactobacillus fungorum]
MTKQRNPWKIAFLTLIGLIVLIFLALLLVVQLPSNSDNQFGESSNTQRTTPISAELNKKQLNTLSEYYLDKLQNGSDNAKYHFKVADQGIVYGSMKLLGANVDYTVFFDPKVLSNGNIELHATKLSLGQFPVPISFVLTYVEKSYRLPKWVQLVPKQKLIKLDINHMSRHGVNYRAKTIDMTGKGKFAFDILLPQ